MALTDDAIAASIQHFPLIAACAVGFWWGFPHMFKKVLNNGGGKQIAEIVQTQVRLENAIQSEVHKNEITRIVDQAIRTHEQVEAERERSAHLQLMNEITDRYDLKPRRSRK